MSMLVFIVFFCAPRFLAATTVQLTRNDFEVWGADQSNSAPDLDSLGVKGGFLWIWDSNDIIAQLAGDNDAKPLS